MTPTSFVVAAALLIGSGAAFAQSSSRAADPQAIILDPANKKAPVDVCVGHKPDERIVGSARELGILLLNGNLAFPQQFQTYYEGLLKLPDATKMRSELILDLHCIDPIDVLLNVDTGEFRIDTWRIQVTSALFRLKDRGEADTIGGIEKQIADTLPKDDLESFCAHFNRLGRIADIPYRAVLTDGVIKISPTSSPPK
jgi:hypothetical protein